MTNEPGIAFPDKLIKGKLIKRYKRFFADCELTSGEVVTAHCANTGSMKTCGAPGDTVYLLHTPDPKRKLKYSWELTQAEGGYIGVNTARPNHVVKRAVEAGLIAELAGYGSIKPEVKYGEKSRIDLYLSEHAKDKRPCYVEIKNTTLRHEDHVVFPDAVTERGLKHIQELRAQIKEGARAVMFYLVNRPDGEYFTTADHIHPAYGEALREATKEGLEVLAYRVDHTLTGMTVGAAVPVKL